MLLQPKRGPILLHVLNSKKQNITPIFFLSFVLLSLLLGCFPFLDSTNRSTLFAAAFSNSIPSRAIHNNSYRKIHTKTTIAKMSASTPEAKTTMSKSLGAVALKELVLQAAEQDIAASSLDLNGIVWLEHINLVVGSRPLAERFYLDLLGCTKDKSASFHVNLGQQQFHLAENGEPAQRVTGSIGLVVPQLATVRTRLEQALLHEQDDWKNTELRILEDDTVNNCMTIICPWGNTMHLYDAQAEVESLQPTSDSPHKMVKLHAEGGTYAARRMAVRGNPGIRYIELACPPDTTSAIAKFYKEMVGCTIHTMMSSSAPCCCITVGPGVHLVYVEQKELTGDDIEAMNGVHICVYAEKFKELYDRLKERQLIWTNPRFTHLDSCDTWQEAKESRTLRFKDIIDAGEGSTPKPIFELEHETRPMRHGQYLKVPFYEPK